MTSSGSSQEPPAKSVRQALRAWSEATLAAIAAAIVFSMPYLIELISGLRRVLSGSFIADKNVSSALSFGLLFIGVLLTVSRRIVESKITTHLTQIAELAKIVDLSGNAHYGDLSRVLKLYSNITNPYFVGVKHELIDQLRFRLSPMATEGTSPPLPASVFTGEEYNALLAARGATYKIRAIATLFDGDFDPHPTAEEEAFVDANKKLIKSGADFERLFVLESADYASAVTRPSVLDHAGRKPEIPGRVVFFETIRQVDPELYRSVGDGFLLFGELVAFVDTPSSDRVVRGKIVTDPSRLAQFHRLYDRLRAYSHAIDASRHPLTGQSIP